jgi:hypothetical protein
MQTIQGICKLETSYFWLLNKIPSLWPSYNFLAILCLVLILICVILAACIYSVLHASTDRIYRMVEVCDKRIIAEKDRYYKLLCAVNHLPVNVRSRIWHNWAACYNEPELLAA